MIDSTNPPTLSSSLISIPVVEPTQYFNDVGNYTRDVNSIPFINEGMIAIYASGLKPNTRVYVHFDKKNVCNTCRAATLSNAVSLVNATKNDFYPVSDFNNGGSGFTTNSAGILQVLFYVPAGTFLIGDREVLIADVSDATNINTATTYGSTTYSVFNASPSSDISIISARNTNTETNLNSTRGTGSAVDTVAPSSRTSEPLCLSFFVGRDDSDGNDGIFLTDVDLYFKTKDANRGFSIQLVSMDNGIPTNNIIPFSRVYLPSSNVSTSAETTFTFPSPVFLRAGFEYGLAMIPDAGSADYSIYTAVSGQKDETDGSTIIRNWGDGILFTASNDTAGWTPIQNEYPKFSIHKKVFSTTSNTITFSNKDIEYLAITNVSSGFIQGEYVFQNGNTGTGNVVFSTTSSNVTGFGTSFSTTFSEGSLIILGNTAGTYDVLTVNSVSNDTVIIVKGYPRFSANQTTGIWKKNVAGQVIKYDPKNLELHLDHSNATNSAFVFTANSIVTGCITGSNATLSYILDKPMSKFQPIIHNVVSHGTSVSLSIRGTISDYSNSAFRSYNIDGSNYAPDLGLIVASRTNEVLYKGGVKSVIAEVTFGSSANQISPTIDTQAISLLSYTYRINNNSWNENKRTGVAHAKYISKRITLAEGLDAEDIVVYLTSYRPPETDIEVYVKILNSADPESFEDKDWTLLNNDQPTIYTDLANRNDSHEYKYTFSNNPDSFRKAGVLTTNTDSLTVMGYGAQFVYNVQPGDIIKIYANSSPNTFSIHEVTNNSVIATGTISSNLANTLITGGSTLFSNSSQGFVVGSKLFLSTNNALVGTVASIASNTSLTLSANALVNVTSNGFYNDSFIVLDTEPVVNSSIAIYDKIVNKNQAFKDPQNNGIVRYYNSAGAPFDTYKSFAIKIVLKSPTPFVVPRVFDVRSIALSV